MLSISLFLFFELVAGQILSTPKNVSTCVGSNVTLTWTLSKPEKVKQYNWDFNGVPILTKLENNSAVLLHNRSRNFIHIQDGVIEIMNVTLENNGIYTLKVAYILSLGLNTFKTGNSVLVKDPPLAPSGFVTGSGKATLYSCETSKLGEPAVSVKIKVGGIQLESNSAVVNFTQPIDCCLVGEAVSCMAENSNETEYCENAMSPSGPESMQLSPDERFYTLNESERLGPITCSAKCIPNCTYQWMKDGIIVENDAELSIATLRIKDRGNYSCIASRGLYVTDTRNISVVVRYGPVKATLSPNVRDVTKNVGTPFDDIECKGDCYPPCTYLWQKDGYFYTGNSSLKLDVLETKEAGNYKCIVENPQISISATAEVTLRIRHGPDIITLDPVEKNYTIDEGETISSISCSSECYPGCLLYWMKKTEVASIIYGNVLSLSIVDRNDTGIYSCIATNNATEFNKTLEETVSVLINYFPDVSVELTNGPTITEDDIDVSLLCSVKGEPANYNFRSWVHYAPNSSKEIRQLYSTSTNYDKASLTFLNVSHMDSGKYECRVSNGVVDYRTGNRTARDGIVLTVKGRPVVTKFIPTVAIGKQQNASLWVEYYSNDGAKTNVTWYHTDNITKQMTSNDDNRILMKNNAVDVNVSYYTVSVTQPGNRAELFIQNVSESDFGDYEVEISNSIRKTVTKVVLVPQGPPDPPYRFSVEKRYTTSSSVVLSWMAGFHNGAEQTFYIQYKTPSTDWKNITHVGGEKIAHTQFNTTINRLSAETQYFFRIFAANVFGRSIFYASVLTATTVPEEKQAESFPVGAAAGTGVGAAVVILIIVLLLVMWKKRSNSKLTDDDSKKTILTKKRHHVSGDHNDTAEINLNPMYESSDTVHLPTINADVYAKVNKQSYPSQPSASFDVYSVVKTTKRKDQKPSKDKTRKSNTEKKKPKASKQADDTVYENADTTTSKQSGADNVYEDHVCSTTDEKPSRAKNDDGLIYIEVELSQQKDTKNKQPVIHGEDRTIYADVAYGQVGEPMDESDKEEK